MSTIFVIMFKIMQQVNGFVNLSLLTRFQLVVALAEQYRPLPAQGHA